MNHYPQCLRDDGIFLNTLRPFHPLTERIPVVSKSVQFFDYDESMLVFYLKGYEV